MRMPACHSVLLLRVPSTLQRNPDSDARGFGAVFFPLDLVFELSEYTFWNCLTLGTVIGTAVTHGAWQPLVSPSLSPEELTGSRC